MLLNRISRIAGILAFGLILIGVHAGSGLAQDNSPSATFNLFSVEGLVVGDTYTFDAEFAERLNVEILAPFRFLTPRADGVKVIFQRPTEGTTELIKINFVTEDEQLIENLRFVAITLPMVEPEGRVQILNRFLSNDAYNMSVNSYEQHEFLGARETVIGETPGIEAIGKYIDPSLGLMYVRLVGIINPDSEHSILAVSNVVSDRAELESLDDLARTFTGTALRHFEYLNE